MKNKKDLDNVLLEVKVDEILLGEGDPEVILIGESHTNLVHAYIISEKIKQYDSEQVLCEGLTERDIYSYINKEEAIGLSLQELFEKAKVSLEYAGFTKETLNKEKLAERLLITIVNLWKKLVKIANEETNAKNKINETERYRIKICPILVYLYNTYVDLAFLPNDYKEIISRPLAAFHPEILQYFLEILRKKREELLNKKSNLERILNVLKDAKIYSELFRKILWDLKSRDYVILSGVYKVGAKIGECDLDRTKFRELLEKARKYIAGEIGDKDFDFRKFNELREKAMAETIEKYVKKRKRKSPIIVVVGRDHVFPVASYLINRGIGCKIVDISEYNYMKDKNSAYEVCEDFLYELRFKIRKIEKICELFKEHFSTDVPCP